jgi:16S rRNA C1402 (ribose-2'-O) methylase RsmI
VTSKKKIETLSLYRLRDLLADFPGSKVVVGIELTELHRETAGGTVPDQAAQSMRQRLVARTQSIYSAKRLPPVQATVFLADRISIRKSNEER